MIEGGDRTSRFDPSRLDQLLDEHPVARTGRRDLPSLDEYLSDVDDFAAQESEQPQGRIEQKPRPPRTERSAAAQSHYRLTTRGKIVFTVLPVAVIALFVLFTRDGEPFTVDGIEDGALIGSAAADALQLQVAFDSAPDPASVSATLGESEVPVTLSDDGTSAVVAPSQVPEGENVLTVSLDRGFPFGSATVRRTFTVDRTPPTLTVLSPTEAAGVTEAVTLQVQVDDPEATVSIDGEPVTVTDGLAEKGFDRPPAAAVEVLLTDPAGNVATVPVDIPLALAGEPGQPPIRGVHASGWTWATPELRDPIVQMIDNGLINTVQLDLKDEGGEVWYDTRVQLAHDIGAVTELWDLAEVVEYLHSKNVRVVGRIVNFRDPRLATYAVEQGNMEWIVQNPDGTPYGKYGGFTNPYNQDVWEYNIELAEEAAELGVDDIMYDYVRRPDDYMENLRFPGEDGPPEDAIIGFLEQSRERVHAAGARLAAAVFGIAATRPDEVAQDIPRMGTVVDAIAPMTYPSHWGPNEYGVANPNAQPYDIVYRSMEDFNEQLAGTGAELIVWVQDFSLGVDYGPAEVRAQIDAAADAGIDSFLLWDAATTYTAAALE